MDFTIFALQYDMDFNSRKRKMIMRKFLLFATTIAFLAIAAVKAQASQTGFAYQQWISKPSGELLKMGTQYENDGQFMDSAMVCFTIIADRYTPQSPKAEQELVVRALNEMGVLNTNLYNNYTAAYQHLILAYDICKEIGMDEMEPYILLNLGNLYNIYEFLFPSEDLIPQARKYYQQSFRAACRKHEWAMAINSYINFSMLSMPYGVGDAAVHREMQVWMRDSIPTDTPDWALTCHFLNGNMAMLDGDCATALQHYRRMAGDLTPGPDHIREQYMVYTCISAAFLQEERYDSAICYANRILELKSQQDLIDIQVETYRLLSEYYTKLGDSKMASKYYMAYLEKKELLMKNIAGLMPTKLSHDLNEVGSEVTKMREQKRTQTVFLVAAAVVIAMLIGFSLSINQKNRQLRQKNLALYHRMKDIIEQDEERLRAQTDGKYKSSMLKEEKKQALLEKIKQAMNCTDDICQPTFALGRLSEMVGSNTSYLSQTINENFGMTFPNLLNLYRVKEACRRMADREHYGNLTIDAIAESVGFKARATFTKAFKQHVGMLPSEYMKNTLKGE